MRTNPKHLLLTMGLGLSITGALGLAPTPVAVAADPELPAPGVYWRSPRPDGLGNLNFALGASVRLHAAPVELARVDRVVYLANGTAVGQVANPPYAFDWTVAGSGAVTLRAEARDGAGAVQGWCERTIQVVGEGLQVAQNALAVTLAPGATTTVSLNLTNLGPGDTEWAIQIQGGMAPGGTTGNIVRTFSNPGSMTGGMTYRHRGTVAADDDEIWLQDFGYPDERTQVRRRSAADWSDRGLFTTQLPYYLNSGYFCAADGDGLWCFSSEGNPQRMGFVLVDPATGVEQRRFWLPTQTGLYGYSTPGYDAHSASGVIYAPYQSKAGAYVERFSLVQVRDRDGLLIADHGGIPSWTLARRYDLGKSTCWADGHLWLDPVQKGFDPRCSGI